MKDSFNREINYLRISVTDLCNLRCVYCMPENGIEKLPHEKILSPERIKEIVEAAASLGIKKIRLTGGEPLVRKGIIDIIKLIKSVNSIEEICLTTNGVLLPLLGKDLLEAGLNRLNISLDTLNKDKYHRITRVGELDDVLNGIKAAQEAGFKDIKINCVLIKGFNDDEILDFEKFAIKNNLTVRFIELMPIGESISLSKEHYISNSIVLDTLKDLEPLESEGVSYLFKIRNSEAKIGLISPLSHMFCYKCNRLRLTSDGKLKPCLHSKEEFDTNGLSKDELDRLIEKAIISKPKQHYLNEQGESSSLRGMNKIGG